MHSIQDILTSAGALIGAVGVVIAAVWGIRSKAIGLLRADLETYKEHVKLLEAENKRQAERIRVLETEVGQLRAATNLSPLLMQMERVVGAIDLLVTKMGEHDEQAKVILNLVKGLETK